MFGGRDLGGFVREARAKVGRDVKLDKSYYLEWGGQFENLERASSRLMLVVPLTLALIFSLLYFAFSVFQGRSHYFPLISLLQRQGESSPWLCAACRSAFPPQSASSRSSV